MSSSSNRPAAAILRASFGAFGDETQRAIANIHIQALFWGSFAAHNLPRGLFLATGSVVAAALALDAQKAASTGALSEYRALQALAAAAEADLRAARGPH